jgi:probable O-glycosylation ligase (exosortase A-associated)
MRDLFLFACLCALLFAALKRPQVGILTWIWITVMNPHRAAFGWLHDTPINDVTAAVTILSCIFHWKQRSSAQFLPVVKLMLAFYLWTTFTLLVAVDFSLSFPAWSRFSKTFLLIALMLMFLNRKHWIIAGIWVFVLSIGFWGVKGGVFTIITGGAHHVFGPDSASWGSNNAVSMAMLICLPLCLAIRHELPNRFARLACIGTAVLMFAALLGTQSRGGLVGLLGAAMLAIMSSRKRMQALLIIVVLLPVGFLLMPDSWKARMETITNYEEDKSASNRIIQWQYAIEIANEHPITGNGFDAFFYQPYYHKYLEGLDENRDVHSNYFQVLGEQGYIGLLIYLSLMIVAMKRAGEWSKKSLESMETRWASPYLDMMRYSIAGYALNGLTIYQAYTDLYWILLTFLALILSCTMQVKPLPSTGQTR